MHSFQRNLTQLPGNIAKLSRNNILLLEYQYIKYFMKYEPFYEINFNLACANEKKMRASFCSELYIVQHFKEANQMSRKCRNISAI